MADEIRFVGTGRPINPRTNPRLDRNASRTGVQQSGVKNVREFQELISRKLDIPPVELGRNASTISRTIGSRVDFSA
ncbi:hypothetical protein ACFL6I_22580 [candidate division KSB1 bacterium]